ncbi:N-acetylmuramoyl-L-alanine amidase [Henriciella sp. AS95]|uniref:N-acetylmuramoyl-L-alanine amidase n=1 Tax=Henriciella sp. AS95 TaxID=3135782 RepID=UPI00316F814B
MSVITRIPSPNFDDRRTGVDMLVLHYTGMQTGQDALDRMCDADASVSAHYMVWENGDAVCLVEEDKRAWHAGVSCWQGDQDLNSRSIGIEIVNGGHDWPLSSGKLPPYPDVQIESVMELGKAIVARWEIPQTRIVGHSDIAPTRKIDPGEHFPWARLAQNGLGLWPLVLAEKEGPLEKSLSQIGYDTTDVSAATAAFQRRWRPARVDGESDGETRQIAQSVADLYASV